MDFYKKYGLFFAFAHVVLLIIFTIYMEVIINDGQRQLLWVVFLIVDFPISLITFFGYDFIPTESNVARYYWPYVSHFILGTLWWYFLPVIFSAPIKLLKK